MISISDSTELLERLSVASLDTSNLSQGQKMDKKTDRFFFLLNKGNEGLSTRQPHTCSLCEEVFSNRFAFKEHLKTFHLKTTRMFCDLCPKICFSRIRIENHIRSAHSKKTFTCNICDYKTAAKRNLQKHKLVHAATVECLICHKKVTSLKQHMRSHRPKKRCLICKKMYANRNMAEHMKRHDRKSYKCESCEQTFDKKEYLRR